MNDEQIIIECCRRLAGSRRGIHAMERLLDWLDKGGLSLDDQNQEAVLALLRMAWGKHPMSVRDTMRDALEVNEGSHP